jgi:hypothetical protein
MTDPVSRLAAFANRCLCDSLGIPAYRASDLRTRAIRRLVTFDPFYTRTVRGPFDTNGDRFHFVAGEHRADIWVATVEGLTP